MGLFSKKTKKEKTAEPELQTAKAAVGPQEAPSDQKQAPAQESTEAVNKQAAAQAAIEAKLQEDAAKESAEHEKVLAQLAEKHDVGQILNDLVLTALEMKASDIHFEPQEKDMRIRFRIDGMLREVTRIDKKITPALIFKIKIVARLRTDEHFAPQDGRIRFLISEDEYLDTRVSILPVNKGEKVVFRLLTQKGRSFSLEELGLVDKDLAVVRKSYNKPYGMIIAAGPTGSGKTTTLYSLLQILNSPEINISTIEDPVEYDIEGVNHVQVNVKTGLTFAAGLRAMLRQDPNVIMIGEIRDAETAKIAINAAMTGHLVLTTIHTNDAPTTIPRLVDMGVEPYLVASTINVVVAQRLARRLCDKCKQEYEFSKFEYDQLLLDFRPDIAEAVKVGDKFFRPGKCEACGNSGYKGRVGLYEVMEVNEAMRKLIVQQDTSDDIFKLARKQGLTTIVEDGVKKLKEGQLSMSELIRVTALKE